MDDSGRLTAIRSVTVEAAPGELADIGLPEVVPLEQILASAPGIEPGGMHLTDEEADAFFEAMGL